MSRLKQFFQNCKCPLVDHVGDFLLAADENNLDWRLLPSISIVESSGGKAAKNNNVLGWGSASSKFPSVKAGIHAVAQRLAKSSLYRHKNVDGVLRTYNSGPEYPARVKQVMLSIGPAMPRIAYVKN